jgi:putative redox protein
MSSSNLRHASLTWTGGLVFEGSAPNGPLAQMDGDGIVAPSPVVLLLLAAASCSGADVVSILEKMRAGLTRCHVEATGTRQPDHPRRLTALHLRFHLAGTALDETKARRAIDLSLEKYCSVIHSLARDIPISYDLVLDGHAAAPEVTR